MDAHDFSKKVIVQIYPGMALWYAQQALAVINGSSAVICCSSKGGDEWT